MIHPSILSFIDSLDIDSVSKERKKILNPLVDLLNLRLSDNERITLIFICTHNSRRSQLAQIWTKVIAAFHGIDLETYSGGVEITAFNQSAVKALKMVGFKIENSESKNPRYKINFSPNCSNLEAFSKIYNDDFNPNSKFVAVMTCSEADGNCPIIPGAEARISITYQDPKVYDGTPLEVDEYAKTSRLIATEMLYVLSTLKNQYE